MDSPWSDRGGRSQAVEQEVDQAAGECLLVTRLLLLTSEEEGADELEAAAEDRAGDWRRVMLARAAQAHLRLEVVP